MEASTRKTNTFVPGEGLEQESKSFTAATSFTAEQKSLIRTMLAEATSAKEVEDIENAVRRGVLPKVAKKAGAELVEVENGAVVAVGTKRSREV